MRRTRRLRALPILLVILDLSLLLRWLDWKPPVVRIRLVTERGRPQIEPEQITAEVERKELVRLGAARELLRAERERLEAELERLLRRSGALSDPTCLASTRCAELVRFRDSRPCLAGGGLNRCVGDPTQESTRTGGMVARPTPDTELLPWYSRFRSPSLRVRH